jgi:hypothetical protein
MRYIPALLALTLLLNACTPDHHDTITTTHSIKSLTIKWTANAPDHDNIDFFYDNTDRVTHIIGHNGDHYGGTIASTDTIFRYAFYYQGNNNLPYLSVLATYFNSTAVGEYEYDYLFYDSQNRVTRDSIVFPPPFAQYYLFDYSYTNNYTIADLDTLRGSNGNYTSFSPFGFTNNFAWKADFDSKVNPLNKLNVSSIYNTISKRKNPFVGEWSVWSLSNANNETTVWYGIAPLSSVPNDKLSFTYNQEGLPLERIWRMGPNEMVMDTLIYNYN